MRWSSESRSSQFPVLSSQYPVLTERLSSLGYWEPGCFLAILLAGELLSAAPSADDKTRLRLFSRRDLYASRFWSVQGHEYVGLLELLEPLGRVSSRIRWTAWRLRYNAVDAEFAAGKTRAKIHGRDFDFSAPFLIENSRGLVPLDSLSALLPRFLGTPVNFHESARRLFIGDVGIQPSFQLEQAPRRGWR